MPLIIASPSAPVLLIIFGILALLVVNLLIAVIEGVAITLLRWNPFRQSMTVSFIMNLVSGVINGILLVLLQHTPFIWIPVSFLVSFLVELFVTTYFKRDAFRKNLVTILVANLASYVLVILPAYYFGAPP